LVWWDDEEDVAATKPIERMIGGASSVDAQAAELVAPRQRRRLLFERADGLPILESRIRHVHPRLACGAAPSKPADRHARSLRLGATGPQTTAHRH
jgi:hypothetical protein